MYYKVVTKIDGKYYSVSNLYNSRLEHTLEYAINTITRPKIKNSKLFVFNDKASALKLFMDTGWAVEKCVFTCEITNPQPCPIISLSDLEEIQKFWEIFDEINNMLMQNKTIYDVYNKYSSIVQLYMAPNNTVVCDTVKLIREIY